MSVPRAAVAPPKPGIPLSVAAINQTDDDNEDSVMLALVPPREAVQPLFDLPEATEDVAEAHITLAYFGSKEECGPDGRTRLISAVSTYCLWGGFRLTGKVNGFGVFANEEENVLWAAWDIPFLSEARTELLTHVRRQGLTPYSNHGFAPHTTLAYTDEPLTTIPSLPPGLPSVEFSRIVVAWGNDWIAIPSAGAR